MSTEDFIPLCHQRACVEMLSHHTLANVLYGSLRHNGGSSQKAVHALKSHQLWFAYWQGVASLLEGDLFVQASPDVPLTDVERALCLGQAAIRIALEGRPN